MMNISFPCQLTTKLRKGTLEEGSRTANETSLKCAVNFNSLESFYLPKLGGSCCLSGSRYSRRRNTFISRYTHTYNHKCLIIIFLKLRANAMFSLYLKDKKRGKCETLLTISVLCMSTRWCGVSFP